jgi:5'-3' exonuclease
LVYSHIILDLSNLFYRLKGNIRNSLDITKRLISYTENDVKKHLDKDGVIWVLFDPLSYSDLGEEKAFLYSTKRKEILPDYKANRKYSDLFLSTIELYRKYYLHRGDKIKLVYSDEFEADDFIEPLLDKLTGKIALVTTDHDFSRYISPDIDMITKDWEKPFTIEEFEKLYKFKPTKESVILYLSLFGDKSDNIGGVIFIKKAKFLYPDGIKMLCLNFLNWINESKIPLDTIISMFKTSKLYEINAKKDRNPFEELFLQLKANDLKLPMMQTLYTNISIIRSQLETKDISEFIHSNPENPAINSVIYQSIYGISFKNIFGKI